MTSINHDLALIECCKSEEPNQSLIKWYEEHYLMSDFVSEEDIQVVIIDKLLSICLKCNLIDIPKFILKISPRSYDDDEYKFFTVTLMELINLVRFTPYEVFDQ